MSDTKTAAEHYLRTAKSDVEFYKGKVDEHLKWLETNVTELRREVERGRVFEQVNLIASASRVANYAGKLAAATQLVETLEDIKKTDGAA